MRGAAQRERTLRTARTAGLVAIAWAWRAEGAGRVWCGQPSPGDQEKLDVVAAESAAIQAAGVHAFATRVGLAFLPPHSALLSWHSVLGLILLLLLRFVLCKERSAMDLASCPERPLKKRRFFGETPADALPEVTSRVPERDTRQDMASVAQGHGDVFDSSLLQTIVGESLPPDVLETLKRCSGGDVQRGEHSDRVIGRLLMLTPPI